MPALLFVGDDAAGARRALAGADTGPRFAICYGAAAAAALFATNALGVHDPYWATLLIPMVMRREGITSIELTIHDAARTSAGVVVASVILRGMEIPLWLSVPATGTAASARMGVAVNPSLGYTSFTMYCCSSRT